jgi:hypothetical protein
LRERLRRTGPSAQIPARPPECRIQQTAQDLTTTFLLPKPPPNIMAIAGLLLFFGVCLLPLFLSLEARDWLGIRLLAVAAIPMVLALAVPLNAFNLREQVQLTPDSLQIVRRTVFGTRIQALTLSEVEELIVAEEAEDRFLRKGGGLIAYTDRGSVNFGTSLTAVEKRWLHAVLRYLIAC